MPTVPSSSRGDHGLRIDDRSEAAGPRAIRDGRPPGRAEGDEVDDLRRLAAQAERFVVTLRAQVEDRDRQLARERLHALEAHTLAASQADEFRQVIDRLIADRDEARRRVAELESALAATVVERDTLAAGLEAANAPRPGLPRRVARRLIRLLDRVAD